MNLDDAVIVALGSNQALGAASPQQVLEAALARFPAFGLEVVKRSRWWRSKAWPEGAGPNFVNGVVLVRTALRADEVLEALHAIEREFGRERSEVNAPRTVDLDLVAYGRRAPGATKPLPPCGEGVGDGGDSAGVGDLSSSPPPPDPLPARGRGGAGPTAEPHSDLVLPHPRAHERLFVMGPLAEIAPNWRHPVNGASATELAAQATIGADARPA